jgi:hypothetical protein
MKIKTINILELKNKEYFDVQSLSSFPNTSEGEKEAEELFLSIAKDAAGENWDETTVDDLLDSGGYNIGDGGVYLIRSNN